LQTHKVLQIQKDNNPIDISKGKVCFTRSFFDIGLYHDLVNTNPDLCSVLEERVS